MTVQILYMEDNPLEREAFVRILEHCIQGELELDTAQTGEEGIAKIKENSYDLIIMDNKMPGKSGLEILEEMRELRSKTPVILLTGSGDEAIAVQAMKLGAKDYIRKIDISPARIIAAINEVLLEVNIPDDIPREALKSILSIFSKTDFINIEQQIQLTSPQLSEEISPDILYGLERLASNGIMEKTPFLSTVVCPSCGAHDQKLRLKCPECSSTIIKKNNIIQHYACGHVDFEESFKRDDGCLVCPQCNKELRTIGVDYTRPGLSYKCSNGHLFTTLIMQLQCTKCGETFDLDEAPIKIVHEYRVRKEGKLKLQIGLHGEADPEAHGSRISGQE